LVACRNAISRLTREMLDIPYSASFLIASRRPSAFAAAAHPGLTWATSAIASR
jgi:hypothetical protein